MLQLFHLLTLRRISTGLKPIHVQLTGEMWRISSLTSQGWSPWHQFLLDSDEVALSLRFHEATASLFSERQSVKCEFWKFLLGRKVNVDAFLCWHFQYQEFTTLSAFLSSAKAILKKTKKNYDLPLKVPRGQSAACVPAISQHQSGSSWERTFKGSPLEISFCDVISVCKGSCLIRLKFEAMQFNVDNRANWLWAYAISLDDIA